MLVPAWGKLSEEIRTYIDSQPFLVSVLEEPKMPALAIRTSSLSCSFSNSVANVDTDAKSAWSRIMTWPTPANPVSLRISTGQQVLSILYVVKDPVVSWLTSESSFAFAFGADSQYKFGRVHPRQILCGCQSKAAIRSRHNNGLAREVDGMHWRQRRKLGADKGREGELCHADVFKRRGIGRSGCIS
jgi:hypothetical protein